MRVKRGIVARRRRKKVLKRASGYYGANSRCFTVAKEKNDRALVYAYRDRKVKKREIRALWIQRINAAARLNGTTYSRLIAAMKEKDVQLDRKALAHLALHEESAFSELVKSLEL